MSKKKIVKLGQEFTLENLSAADLEKVMALAKAAEVAKSEGFVSKKEAFMQKQEAVIDELYDAFVIENERLLKLKANAWHKLKNLIREKDEAFGPTSQKSYSFVNCDNSKKVDITEASIVSFDETSANGAALIKAFIVSSTTSENRHILDMLLNMLGPDREGNLNPKKMTTLFTWYDGYERDQNKQGKLVDASLQQGIEILRAAIRHDKNASYIDVLARTGLDGKWESIKLNFASMPVGAAQSDD